MAVTIRENKKLTHHRNPSGIMNKINWILRESDWDINNLYKLYINICRGQKNSEMWKSWETSFGVARAILSTQKFESDEHSSMNKFESIIFLSKFLDNNKFAKFAKKWKEIRKNRYGY